MTDHEYRLWLCDIFNALPETKRIFEETVGINPDNLPIWMLKGGIESIVDKETSTRKEEKEKKIREEEREFQVKLEKAKLETLKYSLGEVARIIKECDEKNSDKLDVLVKSIHDGYKMLSEKEPVSVGLVSYADCWRKHPATEEFPAGRSGPSQCVYNKPEKDGVHYRCLIAYAAQTPGDKGFARLKYQIFHAQLLREGDCPRPLTRSITRRIPGISWLLFKPDKCPLADGAEYVMKPGAALERLGD